MNVDEILDRPQNRLRLKQKEIELANEKFRQFSKKLNNSKQDPKFYVEKSFERIYNDLDIRREELKIELEKIVDDYYMKLRNDLEAIKRFAIEKLEM